MMTEHPSQFALEAHAVGETDPEVSAHIRECPVCQAYVRDLLKERSAMLNARPPAAFMECTPIRQALAESHEASRSPRWRSLRIWLPSLAAGLLIVLWMGGLDSERPHNPEQSTSSASSTTPDQVGPMTDDILLKGRNLMVEVNRLRGQHVDRFYGDLTIKKGDRISVSIRVAQRTTLDVVLMDDATDTWIPLATAKSFAPGRTDLDSGGSQEVTDNDTRARLLIGPPDAVQLMRDGKDSKAVTVIELSPEGTR